MFTFYQVVRIIALAVLLSWSFSNPAYAILDTLMYKKAESLESETNHQELPEECKTFNAKEFIDVFHINWPCKNHFQKIYKGKKLSDWVEEDFQKIQTLDQTCNGSKRVFKDVSPHEYASYQVEICKKSENKKDEIDSYAEIGNYLFIETDKTKMQPTKKLKEKIRNIILAEYGFMPECNKTFPHEQPSKNEIFLGKIFSSWTEEDIEALAHYQKYICKQE